MALLNCTRNPRLTRSRPASSSQGTRNTICVNFRERECVIGWGGRHAVRRPRRAPRRVRSCAAVRRVGLSACPCPWPQHPRALRRPSRLPLRLAQLAKHGQQLGAARKDGLQGHRHLLHGAQKLGLVCRGKGGAGRQEGTAVRLAGPASRQGGQHRGAQMCCAPGSRALTPSSTACSPGSVTPSSSSSGGGLAWGVVPFTCGRRREAVQGRQSAAGGGASGRSSAQWLSGRPRQRLRAPRLGAWRSWQGRGGRGRPA